MIPLFSENGLQRLDEVLQPRLLCAFDFDGTLAPIVPEPDDAVLSADVIAKLITLSDYAPVAIITGRGIDNVRTRLGFVPDFIIGNHGLEGLPGWEQSAAQYETRCSQWKKQLAKLFEHREQGVWIEDKRYSLSVHYRLAADPQKTETDLPKLFAQLDAPPRVIAGKFVFNLVPDDVCDKGIALARLMELCNAETAIYAGDDVTDEDVFRLPRTDILTVRIGSSDRSAAAYFLERRGDIVRVLDELIDRLRTAAMVNWTRADKASGF